MIVNASVESETLVALDRKTGKEVWRAEGIKESWNTPVLVRTADGKTELVVADPRQVLGLGPGDAASSCGRARTDIPWYMVPSAGRRTTASSTASAAGPDGALAVRAGGRGDVTRTHRLWTGRKGSNVSSPSPRRPPVLDARQPRASRTAPRRRRARSSTRSASTAAGQVYASPVLADGKLYYVSRDGRTFVVAAKPEFELLATNDPRRPQHVQRQPGRRGRPAVPPVGQVPVLPGEK